MAAVVERSHKALSAMGEAVRWGGAGVGVGAGVDVAVGVGAGVDVGSSTVAERLGRSVQADARRVSDNSAAAAAAKGLEGAIRV
jgi:hypothetical protein